MISEISEHCILKIGVAGGDFTLRLLGISGLTAEDSSHTVRFLQSQTIPISNPYAVTCLPRKELQAMFSGFCDTNPAPFPTRFSLCSVIFELCDLVVRVGLAPTLFLMCRVYSPVPSLLSGTWRISNSFTLCIISWWITSSAKFISIIKKILQFAF